MDIAAYAGTINDRRGRMIRGVIIGTAIDHERRAVVTAIPVMVVVAMAVPRRRLENR
jgi:hypothetical protein